MTEGLEEQDFYTALMAATGGGISDDLGWLDIADIQEMAQDTSRALKDRGLQSNEPVLVPIGGHAEDIAAILAVIGAGGTAVPIHCKAHPDTRAHVSTATRARFALTEANTEKRKTPSVVTLSEEPPPRRALLKGAAMITFTSGSTGKPKGVVLARDRISAKLAAIRADIEMEGTHQAAVPLQLQFSFGQWATFLPLMMGGSVHMTARFSPEWANQVLRNHPISHFAAVPTMLRMLVEGEKSNSDLTILTGGEAVSSDLSKVLFQRWPNALIHGIFGLTETGTCDLFRRDRLGSPMEDSLGRPAKQIEVMTDPVTSELLIKTPFAMRGYLDMPEMTEETLRDGWIRTGDMAEICSDGTVRLRGRIKELINRGGNKVSPIEVEAVFANHPALRAVLATGVPDARLGEAIHLLVVPKDNDAPSADTLIDWARGRTDRFKLPDVVHYGQSLPLGATGKADRLALRRDIVNKA